MKRFKSKPAPKNAKNTPTRSLAGDKTLEVAEIQREIIRTVSSRALHMVNATIAEVESGHYLAMKLLFEMTGLFPAKIAVGSKDDSLAGVLLRNFGISDEITESETITKDSALGDEEGIAHPVE